MKPLTEEQLSIILSQSFDGVKMKLTAADKRQFAKYCIEQANQYSNTHSMNKTILLACINQITLNFNNK